MCTQKSSWVQKWVHCEKSSILQNNSGEIGSEVDYYDTYSIYMVETLWLCHLIVYRPVGNNHKQ